MFNVNSTSQRAWRALLGHARNQKIAYITDSTQGWDVDLSEETDHAFSRFVLAGEGETSAGGSSGSFPGSSEFTGFRKLDDGMIDQLAENIVTEVKERGPFLSLSEFVNRQLSSGRLATAGAIQAALDQLANDQGNNPYRNLQDLSKDAGEGVLTNPDSADYLFPAAAEGESAFGLPGWTRQADILRALAPILTVRDDTFTIRAYGDARSSSGEILSRATCEAVVRRTRDFIDTSEEADLTSAPSKERNQTFGRRFELVSFRWLHPDEV
jgi:hypothetical protein